MPVLVHSNSAQRKGSLPSYHLIGHRLCPYVQRVAMVFSQNTIAHKRTDIELDTKPDWFLELSPTGNVPLLVIDSDKSLFESAAICQYLQDMYWTKLFPVDAYDRAFQQGVIAIGDKILSLTANLIYRDLSENMVDATLHQINTQMSIISVLMTPDSVAKDQDLSMLDMVFATVFRPFALISAGLNRDLFAGFPTLRRWSNQLAAHQTVRTAVPATYYQEMHAFIACKDGYLAKRLRAIPHQDLSFGVNKPVM